MTTVYDTTRTLRFSVAIQDMDTQNWIELRPSMHVLTPTDIVDAVPGVRQLEIQKSFDSPVPVCSIDLPFVPVWIKRGCNVIVSLGYNTLKGPVFTGTVQDRGRKDLGAGTVHCLGSSYPIFRTVEIPDRDVNGLTVEQAIEGILDYVGITNRSLSVPAFTLGTASDPVLNRATSGNMLQLLMDIDGLKLWEDGLGIVHINPISGQPASVPFRVYSTDDPETALITGLSDEEDPDALRTRVTVTGATVVEGTAPDETSRTISVTASVVDSPLVQPASGSDYYIDAEYSNHLIDLDEKASEVALRLLSQWASVPRQTTIEVPGDHRLELGQTIRFTSKSYLIDDLFLIEGVTHTVGSNGFTTRLIVRGGSGSGGTLAINPVASFFYRVEREVLDDRVYVFVTFNADSSFDPDGTIVSYSWADNQATATTPSIDAATTSIVTVRIDPTAISGTWEVTLTVTDSDGLTDDVTVSIPIDVTSSIVNIPSIYAALDSNASVSPDGGINWNDFARTGVQAVAARPFDGGSVQGLAVFGCADGSIIITSDFGETYFTVKGSNGVAIVDMKWSPHSTEVCWALDADLGLWISANRGLTWAQYENIDTELGLGGNGIAGCLHFHPGMFTPVVMGGKGTGQLLLAWEFGTFSHTWVDQTIGGELDDDLPGGSTLYIKDSVDKGDGGGLAIILANFSGAVVGIYHCVPTFFQSTRWKRATGLDGGLPSGVYIVPDFLAGEFHAAFANRDTWHNQGGGVGSVAWTKTTNVMPSGVTPNHGMWINEFIENFPSTGVYLVSAENAGLTLGAYKSSDGLLTVGALRPATGFPAWPTSGKGKMMAVGPKFSGVGAPDLFVVHEGGANDFQLSYPVSNLGWDQSDLPAQINHEKARPFAPTSDLVFVCDVGGYPNPEAKDSGTEPVSIMTRSTNGGGSWGNSAIGDEDEAGTPRKGGMAHVVRGADGLLWGCRSKGQGTTTISIDIYSSDDDGATWDLKNTLSVSTKTRYPFRLAAHPTNANVIAVLTANSDDNDVIVHISVDGGLTFDTNESSQFKLDSTVDLSKFWFVITPGFRLIAVVPTFDNENIQQVWTSDNQGVSWTLRYASPA